MVGYSKPCRYCGELVPPDANVCPSCGKINPIEQRCPRCHVPIQENWKACPSCGLGLSIACPRCGKQTFFGDYCQACGQRLTVVCPNRKCRTEQPPIGPNCVRCGKPLLYRDMGVRA